MKVVAKIETNLKRIEEGSTFTYRDLNIDRNEYAAATKAIERYIKKGIINRASTGIFYKPKSTVFGILRPSEDELVKPYLYENNRRVAYITSTALFNRMGLTTQVPKNYKLASRSKRINSKIGNLQIRSVKSYEEVTNENYYLLEILDVLKDFKNIPDINKQQAIKFLLNKINSLSSQEQKKLIKNALKYPPRVRAFLGALLEEINIKQVNKELRNSINPLTEFNFGISKNQLSTIGKWNIS